MAAPPALTATRSVARATSGTSRTRTRGRASASAGRPRDARRSGPARPCGRRRCLDLAGRARRRRCVGRADCRGSGGCRLAVRHGRGVRAERAPGGRCRLGRGIALDAAPRALGTSGAARDRAWARAGRAAGADLPVRPRHRRRPAVAAGASACSTASSAARAVGCWVFAAALAAGSAGGALGGDACEVWAGAAPCAGARVAAASSAAGAVADARLRLRGRRSDSLAEADRCRDRRRGESPDRSRDRSGHGRVDRCGRGQRRGRSRDRCRGGRCERRCGRGDRRRDLLGSAGSLPSVGAGGVAFGLRALRMCGPGGGIAPAAGPRPVEPLPGLRRTHPRGPAPGRGQAARGRGPVAGHDGDAVVHEELPLGWTVVVAPKSCMF